MYHLEGEGAEDPVAVAMNPKVVEAKLAEEPAWHLRMLSPLEVVEVLGIGSSSYGRTEIAIEERGGVRERSTTTETAQRPGFENQEDY